MDQPPSNRGVPIRAGQRFRVAGRLYKREPKSPQTGPLTAREREVVQLLFEGHRYKEIAALLGIAEDTVKAHISNLLDKTGTSTAAELCVHMAAPIFRKEWKNDKAALEATIAEQQETIRLLQKRIKLLTGETV